MYDYSVFIGRFQIPHHGHFYVMKEALKQSRHLIVAIGSSNLGRSLRNPFTFEQRVSMIENSDIPEITLALRENRLSFIPLEDSPYSDTWWIEQVQRKVDNAVWAENVCNAAVHRDHARIALVGCKKDESSYYLEMFPQWDLIEVEQERHYAATECRNAYYEFGPYDKSVQNKLHDYTTQGVIHALQYIPDFVHKKLQQRFFDVRAYQKEWGTGPFETVDSVVIKKGHVLCIKRAKEPFNAGLWALPGGFLDKKDSSAFFGALRELREETGLEIRWYEEKNKRCPTASARFDKPDRDDRAHIITHAFLFKMLDEGPLPEVKGLDDAEEAAWVPLVDLRADNMYGDHYFIIRKLIAGL